MPLLDKSLFVASSLPVNDNAVKNIIFKAASLAFQFFIYRTFAYLAYKANAYTSFLMFAEDIAQKVFFAISRKFNKQALLVLGFALFSTLFGFYDTMLWALDSPGYITRTSTVSASSISSQLLVNPSYLSYISNPTRNVDDINLDEALTSNLFKTGFNFSLPPVRDLGKTAVVSQSPNLEGGRIWLDETGFSVGVDNSTMVTTSIICPSKSVDENTSTWRCTFNNSNALDFLNGRIGDPQIWWYGNNSDLLMPERSSNIWQSLGAGGDTAIMKQLFTVTRGKKRHTFLETAFKASILTLYPIPFDNADITDIIHRTWADPAQPIDNTTQKLADMVIAAQNTNTGFTFGINIQAPTASMYSSIELLNVMSFDKQLYSVLRIGSNNVTLIRSEDLSEAPTPFVQCDRASINMATGGRVQSSTCYKSIDPTVDRQFLGQLDVSSAVILSDVLGDGTSSKAAVGFNQTGFDWYTKNMDAIDNLLISRGVLLGGDRGLVEVDIHTNVPAISYLQLLLTLLPILIALVAWVFTKWQSMSYYQSSFLTSVSTTTHVVPVRSCEKASYLRSPPEFLLDHGDEHVLIRTAEGGTLSYALPMNYVLPVESPGKEEFHSFMGHPSYS